MLQALVKRYETECKAGRLPQAGWEYRGVLFALVLSEAGDLLQVMPLAQ